MINVFYDKFALTIISHLLLSTFFLIFLVKTFSFILHLLEQHKKNDCRLESRRTTARFVFVIGYQNKL